MTLAWLEPFDFYTDLVTTTTGAASRWVGVDLASGGYSLVTGLINGVGQALRLVASGFIGPGIIRRGIPQSNKVSLAFYAKIHSVPNTATPFLYFLDDTPATQCMLQINTSGRLQIVGENGVVKGTGTRVLQGDVIYHFAMSLDLSTPDSDAFILHINGDSVADITVSAQDLQDQSSSHVDSIGLSRPAGNTFDWTIDHMIAAVDETTIFEELELRDVHPNADDAVQWTHSTGASNFGVIDEGVINGDTDYNSSNTPTQKDLFSYAALGFTPEYIRFVGLYTTMRKEESATQSVKTILKVGGVEHPSADKFLSTSYVTYEDYFDNNPTTSAEWAPADLPIHSGYELTSGA